MGTAALADLTSPGWWPWHPSPDLRRPLTSHLQAGSPQQDHDVIDEAQQGHEHRVLVVEPLAEEEREGDVGGSPAEQGQREGPACGGDRPQWGGAWGRGHPRPSLTSILIQLPHKAPQLLQDLVSHGPPPHAQAVEGAHGELARGFPARPRGEEDACRPRGDPRAGAHCPAVSRGWPRPLGVQGPRAPPHPHMDTLSPPRRAGLVTAPPHLGALSPSQTYPCPPG